MTAPIVSAIGYIAGTLTTISFLPQVIKTWRCRSTKDMSLLMLWSFASGVALWLVYGIFVQSRPIIIANAVTFALIAVILSLKLRYK